MKSVIGKLNILRWLAPMGLLFTFVFGAHTASAVPCISGNSYASYQALNATGGCTIGDKIFSNFGYTSSASGGATAVSAAGVTVSAINGVEIGLGFNALWAALTGQLSDSFISFDVAVIGGGPLLIDDASLVQSGSGIIGSGIATVAENACGPAPCVPSGLITLLTLQAGATSILSDHKFFTPTGSLSVTKDIGVSGGSTANSFASISFVSDTFSQTTKIPEPGTLLLLASGLLGLGWVRRRNS